jgi:hypothetical protein
LPTPAANINAFIFFVFNKFSKYLIPAATS